MDVFRLRKELNVAHLPLQTAAVHTFALFHYTSINTLKFTPVDPRKITR